MWNVCDNVRVRPFLLSSTSAEKDVMALSRVSNNPKIILVLVPNAVDVGQKRKPLVPATTVHESTSRAGEQKDHTLPL